MKTTIKFEKEIIYGLAIGTSLSQIAQAQFNINGQYMSRGEYRHGYQTLADTNQKASIFISQRAKLSSGVYAR